MFRYKRMGEAKGTGRADRARQERTDGKKAAWKERTIGREKNEGRLDREQGDIGRSKSRMRVKACRE